MVDIDKSRSKSLYFLVFSLLIYLVIRLINQSKIISSFPLDYTNDISSHIADLFFLKECGFHSFCPYWYNGFSVLLSYPPGWHFFTYPLYILSNNLLLSTYMSIILLYLIGFMIIFAIGKAKKFPALDRIAFFLLFLANPFAISGFIRLGRVTELFGWVSFLALAYLIILYKDKEFDWKFAFFIIAYAVVMISHFTTMVFANILVLSFFLAKKPARNKAIIVLFVLLGLALVSFWLAPFLLSLSNTSLFDYRFSGRVIEISLTSLAALTISLLLWIIFYLNWKQQRLERSEFMFMIPILTLNILFLSDLVNLIPVFRDIYTNSYIFFFLFISLYLFFKTRFDIYRRFIKRTIIALLIILPILFILVSVTNTPWFLDYTPLEDDTLKILPEVSERFVILDSGSGTSYTKAYYSYAPIYHRLYAAGGWKDALISREYRVWLSDVDRFTMEGDCINFIETIGKLNSTEVIGYKNMRQCAFLDLCHLNLKASNDNVCLYKL